MIGHLQWIIIITRLAVYENFPFVLRGKIVCKVFFTEFKFAFWGTADIQSCSKFWVTKSLARDSYSNLVCIVSNGKWGALFILVGRRHCEGADHVLLQLSHSPTLGTAMALGTPMALPRLYWPLFAFYSHLKKTSPLIFNGEFFCKSLSTLFLKIPEATV